MKSFRNGMSQPQNNNDAPCALGPVATSICSNTAASAAFAELRRSHIKQRKLIESNKGLAESLRALRQQSLILKGLAEGFHCLCFMELNTGIYRFLSEDRTLSQTAGTEGNIETDLYEVIRTVVAPEHQATLIGKIAEMRARTGLPRGDRQTLDYLDLTRGWCRAELTIVTRDSEGNPLTAIFTSRGIDEDKQRETELEDSLARLEETIPELLYQSYEFIGILNLHRETLSVRKCGALVNLKERQTYDYAELQNKRIDGGLAKEDASLFRTLSSLDHIAKQLETTNRYSFSIGHINEDGSTCLVERHYQYMDEERGLVLLTAENVTEESELDPITNLKNYAGFLRLARKTLLERPYDAFAVIYFDVQDFNSINNLIGFESGNLLLSDIAGKIRDSKLNPIVSARCAGGRFCCLILQEDLCYDCLVSLAETTCTKQGDPIAVRMLSGVCLVQNSDDPVRKLCDRARIAMQTIANEYAQPYRVYEPSMTERHRMQSEALREVNDALESGDFKVYYQPIFDAKTHRIVSAESLVRWMHPVKGMLSPDTFIPTFESHGHISKIDQYVLGQVESFLSTRQANGSNIVPVSVNLSRMDFLNDAMQKTIMATADQTSLKPGYLRFEVTESALHDISQTGKHLLRNLRTMGSKVLLDDFGTGYSSLGSLAEQEFDIIKLDMSFVRNIGSCSVSQGIIEATVNLAHSMNSKVVAEGVETQQQLDFLVDCGCDYVQGYYFSRPIPEEEFAALLG